VAEAAVRVICGGPIISFEIVINQAADRLRRRKELPIFFILEMMPRLEMNGSSAVEAKRR